jgi:Family of unknown function (DUF5996)
MTSSGSEAWPELPYPEWRDTCTTLHLWLQIVGKVRLALTPWINHSWHATFYVTARGLTTSPMAHGQRVFEVEFDFIDHVLLFRSSDGRVLRVPLEPQTVADFYGRVLAALDDLALPVAISGSPSETPDPIPFRDDRVHGTYDAAHAQRFWRVLLQVDRVFKQFRTAYLGKVSPVHLFWGALDLTVTRFSGRTAPLHPGGIPNLPDAVTREAYSHEVSSAGFWPGGGPVDQAIFYSYAYPAAPAFRSSPIEPAAAYYLEQLGEFVLPYDAMRTASAPDQTLLAFLDSTYRAAAETGNWDRAALECKTGVPGVVRTVS